MDSFGETLFAVGTWEEKDIISRDGRTQLSAKVFFASFDILSRAEQALSSAIDLGGKGFKSAAYMKSKDSITPSGTKRPTKDF